MVHHRWLVGRAHHEDCRRDDLASAPLAMNQSIYFVRAPIFFSLVLGLGFLFLCLLDRLRKKQISLGFNFVAALIVGTFLLFVTWFRLP
jgi:hypothetical protein